MANIKGSGFTMIVILTTILFGAFGATFDSVYDAVVDLRDVNASIDPSAPAKRSPVYGRIIYACVSLVALCCVAGMLTTRTKTHLQYHPNGVNLVIFLSLGVYFLSICFIFSVGILMNGWDLTNASLCHGSIILCLVFYVGQKVFMYLFLVERCHILTGQKSRRKDYVFWIGLVTVLLGFGLIAIFAFIYPVTGISNIDGMCRIGLPLVITIPLLVYDVTINVALTLVHIWFGMGYVKDVGFKEVLKFIIAALPFKPKLQGRQTIEETLKYMLARSFLGLFAVICPTVANLVILFKVHGHEQGWLCFTICTIDVAWGAVIIHWLTSTAADLGNHRHAGNGNNMQTNAGSPYHEMA